MANIRKDEGKNIPDNNEEEENKSEEELPVFPKKKEAADVDLGWIQSNTDAADEGEAGDEQYVELGDEYDDGNDESPQVPDKSPIHGEQLTPPRSPDHPEEENGSEKNSVGSYGSSERRIPPLVRPSWMNVAASQQSIDTLLNQGQERGHAITKPSVSLIIGSYGTFDDSDRTSESDILGSYGASKGLEIIFDKSAEREKRRSRRTMEWSVGNLNQREKMYNECMGEECLGEFDDRWIEYDGEGKPLDYEVWESYGTSPSRTASRKTSFTLEDKEDENEEEFYQRPVTPRRIPSEDEFLETYMHSIPGTPARERMSQEAFNLSIETRKSTPSPPGTPTKILRRMHECPSVESFLKLGDPVHVHFYVLPGQKLFSIEARLDRTIADLKHDISPICKVPPEFLDIRRNKNLVMDYKTLKDLGGKPRKKMKFTIELSKRCPLDFTLKIPVENKIVQLPTMQKRVKVQTEKGVRHIRLTIEFASDQKIFIGGYRDKRFNIVYHHAMTQTPFYSEPYSDKVQHFSCQTFDNTWKTMQTLSENYTQTYRIDYHVSSVRERIVWARPYLHAEYLEIKRVRAAIIIQKYWRRWLAIRERAERLDGLIRRVEWAENIRKGRTESRLAIKEDEMWRQHHPSRMVDVELLYRAINEWRREQVEYIELYRWGPDRKAALAVIMEKEADLLLDLERTKTTIINTTYDTLIESIFKKMGSPTRWLNRSGNFVAMDNKDKYDLRQYHKLYNTLKAPATDVAERCALLDKLISYVKPYNSSLSHYIITLIDREKVLMERNAGRDLLVGLRQRILNIFYHMLRDPRFNPEARKLQKVPFDSTKLRKDMIQCKGCRKMQYREQFTIVQGVTVTTRCVTCMALYRTCILRSDLNLYRRMLSELRHDEQSAGVDSSVTYLIDAYDMQFLIEQLWHGQSALSGIDDRYLLRLCRWKRNIPWSPWNCVLLTEEESVAHLHLEDMFGAYQKSFFHKVHVKHQGARIYFSRLTSLSIPLDPALEAYCTKLKKEKFILKRKKKTNQR